MIFPDRPMPLTGDALRDQVIRTNALRRREHDLRQAHRAIRTAQHLRLSGQRALSAFWLDQAAHLRRSALA